MNEQSREDKSWRMYKHPLVILWLATMVMIAPMIEWFDAFILFLGFTILPGLALLLWLLGMPLWILWQTVLRLHRERWDQAVRTFSVLPIGVALVFVGLKVGDALAVLAYGPSLKREVEAVKRGAAPRQSDGVFSSSLMAFRLTGGWLDISMGIVYDASGRVGELLPLPTSDRPEEWQAHAVDVLTCRGSARHLYGNFYRIVVSLSSC